MVRNTSHSSFISNFLKGLTYCKKGKEQQNWRVESKKLESVKYNTRRNNINTSLPCGLFSPQDAAGLYALCALWNGSEDLMCTRFY